MNLDKIMNIMVMPSTDPSTFPVSHVNHMQSNAASLMYMYDCMKFTIPVLYCSGNKHMVPTTFKFSYQRR